MTRSRRRRAFDVVAIPALYVVAGMVLAAAALGLDTVVGTDALPAVRFGTETARALLIALTGAYVTVVAIVFWVRIYAVQLSAGPLSSRVLRLFLTDPVQRHSMGIIIGALAFNLVAIRGVPDGAAGLARVPHLTLNLACAIAILTAGVVVFAVHNAAQLGQIGRLIRSLTDGCVALIHATHPPLGASDGDGDLDRAAPARPQHECHVVRAPDSGWIQRIDERGLLDALPPGGTIELPVRVGSFATGGTPLCLVWADGDRDMAEWRVQEAIAIGTEPTLADDLGYGIRELVDIADRALSQSNRDSTTAREVVLHLGVVLRELLTRDLPTADRTDPDGRRLLWTAEQTFDDYVDDAFDRIRIAGAFSPDLSLYMLSVLAMLVDEVRGVGVEARARPLRTQAQLVLEGAERTLARRDFERLLDRPPHQRLVDQRVLERQPG